MSTLTWKEAFYRINEVSYNTFRVCITISYICLSLWFLLSLIWGLILSSGLYKDWKTFKIQTSCKHFMSGKEWNLVEKNYRLKRNKKFLMIFLCVVEAIVSLLIFTVSGSNMINSEIFHQLGVYVIQPFNDFQKLSSLQYRLVSTLTYCLVLMMLNMVSFITTYLIQYYAYYSSNKKHPIFHGIFRLSLKIIVISILGSVVQLIMIQLIIGFLLYCYEITRNIVLMRKLVSLLYQRYFDARFHEYHPPSVVAYYKRSYLEFRIASSLYITSLLFHTISLLIETFYPIILMILTNPKWLQHVFNIPIEKDQFVDWLNWTLLSVNQIMVILMATSFTLGLFFMIIPYLFVTLSFFYKLLKRIYTRRNYTFRSDLVQKMLIRNNNAYMYRN